MRIDENIVLGLDLGIGSIGWALIEEKPEGGERRILQRVDSNGVVRYAVGSRVFDVPEDPKTKELLNVARRQKRMLRRVTARRAQRMRGVRALLARFGVVGVRDADSWHHVQGRPQISPWDLRVLGLTQKLSERDFSTVLLHIAKHRGFRSNSKNADAGADASESQKVLSSMQGIRRAMEESHAETVGAFLAGHERKRNRCDCTGGSSYDRFVHRDWQEEEVRLLFERQRGLGNVLAVDALLDQYVEIAFGQRPLKSVAGMVGWCPFIPGDRRAPAYAPTSERFRYLQRLVNLRLVDGNERRPLSREELSLAVRLFDESASKSISFARLRRTLGLDASVLFDGLSYSGDGRTGRIDLKAERQDVARRSGECRAGTQILIDCIGREAFDQLYGSMSEDVGWTLADLLVKVVSDNDDLTAIRNGLEAAGIANDIVEKVVQGAGKFSSFRGTMRLGVKAMLAIMPALEQGMTYDEACDSVGFDFNAEREVDVADIRNPVVQHLLREVRRQVRAICHEFGCWPGRVNIELLRDVGKSASERGEIDRGIRRRTKEREEHAGTLAELWGREPSGAELRRYELWLEQKEVCAYVHLLGTGHPVYRSVPEGHIPIDWLMDGTNLVQIDHILPRSRTFDNSFTNQCLCLSAANQQKRSRTPWEWVGAGNAAQWDIYRTWVMGLPMKMRKKRAYLLTDLSEEVEGRFHARNLTDSAYVARLVSAWLRQEYARMLPNDSRRRVFARPGAVTNYLRHAWGVQSLKKDGDGRRVGDQHHALDAVLVACCTESMIQKVTDAFRACEEEHLRDSIPCPWGDFRESLCPVIASVSVSRPERMVRTGALHEETLRSVREETRDDGKTVRMVYERKWVGSLSLKDLERIKDPDRSKELLAVLRSWIDSGKHGNPSIPSTGAVVRHVRLRRGEMRSGILLRRGGGVAQADNGGIARVDVFTKDGKFYAVPVYIRDLSDKERIHRACKGKTGEEDWPVMDASYAFLFSVFKGSFLRIVKKNGEVLEGYFSSIDRSTASISISGQNDSQLFHKGIGILNLREFQKYAIDRLGNRIQAARGKDPREL